MSIEAMKQALEALEEACRDRCNAEYNPCYARTAITSLRQAIEQAEKQEPMAWGVPNTRITERQPFMMLLHSTDGCQYPEMLVPLYTIPQPQRELTEPPAGFLDALKLDVALRDAREWVGLTDEDKKVLVEQARKVPAEVPCPDYNERLLTFADNKLREKNWGEA